MTRVLTGLIIGGVVGTAVGLLIAPTSGEELRRMIRKEIDDAQENARSQLESAQERGRQLQNKGREVVEGIKEDVESIGANIADTAQKRRKSILKSFRADEE